MYTLVAHDCVVALPNLLDGVYLPTGRSVPHLLSLTRVIGWGWHLLCHGELDVRSRDLLL